ncbi:HAD family hydrolase [Streptomyces sp. NPDC012623]|uniref:HAD family hydrolase n=1 Tax=unclassified Streptomyces TaxID=2593676 RepID=UPI0036CB20F1
MTGHTHTEQTAEPAHPPTPPHDTHVHTHWDPRSAAARLHWDPPPAGHRRRVEFTGRAMLSFTGDQLCAVDLFDSPDTLARTHADHPAARGIPLFDCGWLWLPLHTGPPTKRLTGHARIEAVLADRTLTELHVRAHPLWTRAHPPWRSATHDPATALAAVQLVAMDLDGTLLDSAGTIPARVRTALHTAQHHGIAAAFVTGRPLADTLTLLREAGLHGYVAASNGAVVQDENGRLLHRRAIDGDRAATVRRTMRDRFPHAVLGAVDENRLFLDPGFPADLAHEWNNRLCAGTACDALASGQILKILLAHPTSTAEELAPAVSAALGEQYLVTYSTQRFLEISDARATKGRAVTAIAAAAGLPLTAVAVVGDMPNDLPMMALPTVAAAVGNAHPRVLDAADIIVPGNDHHGVADLLEAVTATRRKTA